MNEIQALQGNAPPQMARGQKMTAEQYEKVSSILSEYDPDSLTAEEAEEIRLAFQEAGITPSRDLRGAIEKAGFDAEALRGERGGRGAGPPPPAAQGQSMDSLRQLQEILNQYDLSNLDTKQQTSLVEQLQQTGLLQSGLYINLQS